MKRGTNRFNNFFNTNRAGPSAPKDKPIFHFQSNEDENSQASTSSAFGPSTTDQAAASAAAAAYAYVAPAAAPGSFLGWKLYFHTEVISESNSLVRRINAMEMHFRTFAHWYDLVEIERRSEFPLNLKNLDEDEELAGHWMYFDEELRSKAAQTLAIAGLAMHNLIAKTTSNLDLMQHQKIYARPIGFEPVIKPSDARRTRGELVCVSGIVTRMEPLNTVFKMICFRCSLCRTEIIIKQNPRSSQVVTPSTCHRGCPAKENFKILLSSSHTVCQARQKITIQEAIYVEDQQFKSLEVVLTQKQVDTVTVGVSVIVTGVLKYVLEKQGFMKKTDGKELKPYLKCFNIEVIEKTLMDDLLTQQTSQFLNQMKSEKSPFRALLLSFCPTIFGHEEVKAGLILCLLSGKEMRPVNLRSESHILLVGDPGTGKSQLLTYCTDVSAKGLFVCGPTSTAAGLTAAVQRSGGIEAGALILTDEGACCIDEFDKLLCPEILLEVMEHQTVSITKAGVMTNTPARTVIIAAANPKESIYDNSKTMQQNVKMTEAMMSRFDLIFKMVSHVKSFSAHINQQNRMPSQSSSGSFFKAPCASYVLQATDRKSFDWLKRNPSEEVDVIPLNLVRFYIEFVRENFKPMLSEEATEEITKFFKELRFITAKNNIVTVTYRQLEGLLRLTLARARADMTNEATLQHAIDVINLVKYSMVDIFPRNEPEPDGLGAVWPKIKKPAGVVSSLSKPKQMKAFLNELKAKAEEKGSIEFTNAELKQIGKEMGITDFNWIVDKLNHDSVILMIHGGFKLNPFA